MTGKHTCQPGESPNAAPPANSAGPGLLAIGALAIAAYVLLALGMRTDSVRNLSIVFAGIMLEATPFMLAGALLGGLIEKFLSRDRMSSLLPKREWLAVGAAAAMGMLFPVCECAIVPVARRLARKGLPAPAAIAYLLGGPIVNPVVAASTALAYSNPRWQMPALRLVLGYIIAVTTALILGRLFRRTGIFAAETDAAPAQARRETHHTCGCGHAHHIGAAPLGGRIASVFRHGLDDFIATAPYLVAGAFIAALAQTYVDRRVFVSVGAAPMLSSALMMLLAVALNLCSEADAFIAASFRGLVPYSAQLAFLLIGPMFDIKLLLMYQGVFRKKVIVALVLLTTGMVFAASVLAGIFWKGSL